VPAHKPLTSAGAGVRFFLGGVLQADVAVAFPLGYRAPHFLQIFLQISGIPENVATMPPDRPNTPDFLSHV
jgi:hypothetical protein